VTDKLTIKGSVLYFESDGQSDVFSQNNFGNPLPITAYDDTKRTSLNLKAIYAYDKNWSFTGGYAFERWRYNDAAHDGYQYTIPSPGVTTNVSQSYLNGYLAFTNYNANIFYLLATPVAPHCRPGEAPGAAASRPGRRRRAAAPGAGSASRTAGPEDYAGLEGAVRLRPSGTEARRQGGDRQPGHGKARPDAEARGRRGNRSYRPARHRSVQPEAIGAPRGCGA
jgi:hypothetical protein